MDVRLNSGERIDDLQCKGLKLIQKESGFCFGIDAVLLVDFADVRKNDRVIDLGTGTGIIPILLAGKTQAELLVGLEIQEQMVEMASRSVLLNDLQDRVKIVWGDIRDPFNHFKPASFDAVVTNPPYIKKSGGIVNPSDTKAISRHELFCSLEDVIRTSSKLLKPYGRFAMVHRPERLADIIYLMRTWKIEPKYLRFVHPSPYRKPNLVLIRGVKNGNPELKMMEPLYVYDENGNYSEEINRIYSREVKEVD